MLFRSQCAVGGADSLCWTSVRNALKMSIVGGNKSEQRLPDVVRGTTADRDSSERGRRWMRFNTDPTWHGLKESRISSVSHPLRSFSGHLGPSLVLIPPLPPPRPDAELRPSFLSSCLGPPRARPLRNPMDAEASSTCDGVLYPCTRRDERQCDGSQHKSSPLPHVEPISGLRSSTESEFIVA